MADMTDPVDALRSDVATRRGSLATAYLNVDAVFDAWTRLTFGLNDALDARPWRMQTEARGALFAADVALHASPQGPLVGITPLQLRVAAWDRPRGTVDAEVAALNRERDLLTAAITRVEDLGLNIEGCYRSLRCDAGKAVDDRRPVRWWGVRRDLAAALAAATSEWRVHVAPLVGVPAPPTVRR